MTTSRIFKQTKSWFSLTAFRPPDYDTNHNRNKIKMFNILAEFYFKIIVCNLRLEFWRIILVFGGSDTIVGIWSVDRRSMCLQEKEIEENVGGVDSFSNDFLFLWTCLLTNDAQVTHLRLLKNITHIDRDSKNLLAMNILDTNINHRNLLVRNLLDTINIIYNWQEVPGFRRYFS